MAGTLQVPSQLGKGSTFAVALPAAIVVATPAVKASGVAVPQTQ